jgi:hypothetical protein
MRIIERRVMKLHGTFEAFQEQEKRWEALEKRVGGFGPKKHYQLFSGSEDRGTIVWEREWESLATMEAAYGRTFDTDELKAEIHAAMAAIVTTERLEIYTILSM